MFTQGSYNSFNSLSRIIHSRSVKCAGSGFSPNNSTHLFQVRAKRRIRIQQAQDFQGLSGLSSERLNDILQRAPVDVVEIIAATVRNLCLKLNLTTTETSNLIRKVRDGNMGYLFENMEKMDIQLERRNTAEQRKRAEKAEERAEEERQRAEEAEQKVRSAHHMLIQSYRLQGMDKATVKQLLICKVPLKEAEAEELLEMFWKE